MSNIVLFAYPIKLNILTRNGVIKILRMIKLLIFVISRALQCNKAELQKSHGRADITREEGLQNGQSVRKVSCQHAT